MRVTNIWSDKVYRHVFPFSEKFLHSPFYTDQDRLFSCYFSIAFIISVVEHIDVAVRSSRLVF